MKYFAKLARACLALVLFGSILSAFADSPPQRVVYVNGVMTTQNAAELTRRRIAKVLTEDATMASRQGVARTFDVQNVWNPIGWSTPEVDDHCTPGLGFTPSTNSGYCMYRDNIELVMLKTGEESYLTALGMIKSPHYSSQSWSESTFAWASRIAQYSNLLFAQGSNNNGLVKGGLATADSMHPTSDAIDRLSKALRWKDWVDENGNTVRGNPSTILVAHSQGNLLANIAYAKVAGDMGEDPTRHVRVINLANLTRVSINDLSMTNEADGAIWGVAQIPQFNALPIGLTTMISTYNYHENGPQDLWYIVKCLESFSCWAPPQQMHTWYRTTDLVTDAAADFKVEDATFTKPLDQQDDAKLAKNHLMDMYIGCDAPIENTSDGPCEGYADGAEHVHLTKVIHNPWVSYRHDEQRFQDFFSDLVYAAINSLNKVNLPAPVWSDNFSDSVKTKDSLYVDWNAASIHDGTLDLNISNGIYGRIFGSVTPKAFDGYYNNSPTMIKIANLHFMVRQYIGDVSGELGSGVFVGMLNGRSFYIDSSRVHSAYTPLCSGATEDLSKVTIVLQRDLGECRIPTTISAIDYENRWISTIIDYNTSSGILSINMNGDVVNYSTVLPSEFRSAVVYTGWNFATGDKRDSLKFMFMGIYDTLSPSLILHVDPGQINPGPIDINPCTTNPDKCPPPGYGDPVPVPAT